MASRTLAQVVEVVRGIVQDSATPFRYSTTSILTAISEAVAEARRIRPDLFVENLLDDSPWYTESNLNDPLPLPTMYFPAVVNFVAGRTQLRDEQFSSDGRAVMLISSFGTALTGGSRS